MTPTEVGVTETADLVVVVVVVAAAVARCFLFTFLFFIIPLGIIDSSFHLFSTNWGRN